MSFTIKKVPKENDNDPLYKHREPKLILDDIDLIKRDLGFIDSPPEHDDDYELIPDESAGYHHIQDFFSIESNQFPDFQSSNNELLENILAAMKLLSEKEAKIICSLYKINNNDLNKEELSELLEMKDSKIKELETKALKKLRAIFENSSLYN